MASVREPDLFRCAIGVAGPYDLPTMYKRGDVRESREGKIRLARYIGTDTATLRADSPSNHAAAIKAALLLVQGGRDRRVPPRHAEIMRQALDKAGKPYEWFLASDETHGFYDDRNEREYYARVFAFLDRHLQAPPADPTAGDILP
jgi:dipeptidyl aminopeptidase/acylaminoacyl peptidase